MADLEAFSQQRIDPSLTFRDIAPDHEPAIYPHVLD